MSNQKIPLKLESECIIPKGTKYYTKAEEISKMLLVLIKNLERK